MLFYVHNTYTTQELIKPLLHLHFPAVSFWQQAGMQINGKGQRGRFWHSEFGNLYITGHFINQNNLSPGQISITVGVALANMLENLIVDQEISLKWPNDLLINGQKCGGILIEKYLDDSYLIGVGINISSHPENVETPATHLNLYGSFNIWDIALRVQSSVADAFLHTSSSRGAVGDVVIHKSYGLPRCARNDAELSNIDFADVQKQWWHFAKRSVNNWVTREPIVGEVLGIDHQGQLLIQMPDGSVQARYNRL